MIPHWTRKPSMHLQMKWAGAPCWGEVAGGGWGCGSTMARPGWEVRDSCCCCLSLSHLPLGIASFLAFPSWTSQHTGDPGGTSWLGYKPAEHQLTPCFRRELDTSNGCTSELHTTRSQHTLGSPVIRVLLKVLSCMWRTSFELVWSAFLQFAIRIACR